MTGTTTSTSAWCRCCCSTCPSICSPGPNFPTAIGVLVMALLFILGSHGPARPVRPLPLQTFGEPRCVPAACRYRSSFCCGMHVSGEIPDLLFPAHHVRPGVLGVGPVLAGCARRTSPRTGAAGCLGRIAVHGARGRRAVRSCSCCRFWPSRCSGAPTSPSAGWPPARGVVEFACLVAPYVRGGRGHHGLQLRALRLADRFRRELQSDGERHDQARHGTSVVWPRRSSPTSCSRPA